MLKNSGTYFFISSGGVYPRLLPIPRVLIGGDKPRHYIKSAAFRDEWEIIYLKAELVVTRLLSTGSSPELAEGNSPKSMPTANRQPGWAAQVIF
jgi:hypothetical protein